MRVLICAAMLVLGGCCHTEAATPYSEPIPQVADPGAKAKQQVNDAWMEAENEEIVSAVEKSDPRQWALDSKRHLALAERHEIGIYLQKSSHVFFRMTVFADGTLFLDDMERQVSAEHTRRLSSFYDKIVLAGRQP